MLAFITRGSSPAPSRIDDRPLLVHHVARICGISPRTVRWAAQRGYPPAANPTTAMPRPVVTILVNLFILACRTNKA